METTRWTSFLAMFAAIVFSSWLIIGGKGETVVPQEQVHTDFFGEFEEVRSIEVGTEGRIVAALRLFEEDGRWWLAGDPRRPADPAMVERVLRIIESPRHATLQSVQKTSAAKFGLTEEEMIILNYSDGSPLDRARAVSVLVGSSDPNGNDTFVRMAENPIRKEEIPADYTYRVEGEIRYLFDGQLNPTLWQSRYVTWIDSDSVSAISVTGENAATNEPLTVGITKAEGPFWNASGAGKGWKVDRGAVMALLRGVSAMQASDAPKALNPEDLEEYGFNNPLLHLEISDELGEKTIVEVGKKVPTGGDYYYARDTGSPFVYEISGYFIGNALIRPMNQINAGLPKSAPAEAAPAEAPSTEDAPEAVSPEEATTESAE